MRTRLHTLRRHTWNRRKMVEIPAPVPPVAGVTVLEVVRIDGGLAEWRFSDVLIDPGNDPPDLRISGQPPAGVYSFEDNTLQMAYDAVSTGDPWTTADYVPGGMTFASGMDLGAPQVGMVE